VVFLKDNIVRV